MWAIPLKNKNSQTIADAFLKTLSTSKRSPLKLESDRGAEFYNSILQNFLKSKNIHHSSRFTDNGPSIAERVSHQSLLELNIKFKLRLRLGKIKKLLGITKKQPLIHQPKVKPPYCPSCKRKNWLRFDKGYYCKNCEYTINKQKYQIDKKSSQTRSIFFN